MFENAIYKKTNFKATQKTRGKKKTRAPALFLLLRLCLLTADAGLRFRGGAVRMFLPLLGGVLLLLVLTAYVTCNGLAHALNMNE